MIPSQAQIFKRWDSLPEAIKDYLYSETLFSLIDDVGKKEHLSHDRMRGLRRVVGSVLFGFLHPGDVAHELKNELQIPAPLAETIASSLSAKAFAPYDAILAKLYAPPEKDVAVAPKGQPAMIDIAPQMPAATPQIPVIIPKTSGQDEKKLPPPLPVELPPVAASPAPGTDKNTTVKETPTNQVVAPRPAPAPFILQEEKAALPTKKDVDFRLRIDEKLFGRGPLSSPTEQKRMDTGKPAQIELGLPMKEKPTPEPTAAKEKEPRVVHYTQFSTPVSPFAPQGESPKPSPQTEVKPKDVGEVRGLFREKTSTGSLPRYEAPKVTPVPPPAPVKPPATPLGVPSGSTSKNPLPAPPASGGGTVDLGSLIK